MKRLIICCDGTWQSLGQDTLTNIATLAKALSNRNQNEDHQQIVYYSRGVGSVLKSDNTTFLKKLNNHVQSFLGGAFGQGIEDQIFDAYRFLACNYEPGDKIYMFGFSRGAFAVRSLCGLIYASGLVRRENLSAVEEAYELYRDADIKPGDALASSFRQSNGERTAIEFLGCFDTVEMTGMPNLFDRLRIDAFINRQKRFHDHKLNRTIKRACHACALDEKRRFFPLTNMEPSDEAEPDQVIEMWFPGHHGGVGGGERAAKPFADAALLWMASQAEAAGLYFSRGAFDDVQPDALAAMSPPTSLTWLRPVERNVGDSLRDVVLSKSAYERFYCAKPPWRPKSLEALLHDIEARRESWEAWH
ncbi:MAG: DUF2235 domain-containing protein [Pseudomonadota bacterium]